MACALVVASGCEREGVASHEVAKGVERVPESDGDAGGAASPDALAATAATAPGADRPWTVPAGWVEDPMPRQMRLATYVVPATPDSEGSVALAEVAVTRFGGRVGGDLANINRWRGQMGVGPIAEAELESAITRFSAPGYDGYEARIESAAGVMLAAGVYDESIDQMWFVRTTVAEGDVADRIQADVFGMARSIAGLGD